MLSVFAYYFNLVYSSGCHQDLPWAVVNPGIAVAIVFAFLAGAGNGVPDIVNIDDDPRLMMEFGGVLA